jgi:hypothetical protein
LGEIQIEAAGGLGTAVFRLEASDCRGQLIDFDLHASFVRSDPGGDGGADMNPITSPAPAKLNLTLRDEERKKLEQMASLENRSLSNLIEVMADERWKRLAEQQGVAYAKTVAEAMNLKLDADNPADREKLRRAVLDLVAGRKMPKQKGASLSR